MDALLSITYSVEMSPNFPYRDSDWRLARGAIDAGTREYLLRLIGLAADELAPPQLYVLGSSLEDPDIDYLEDAAELGCAIGVYTYNHIDVKALTVPQLGPLYAEQPWRAAGRSPLQVVDQEIRSTAEAIRHRFGCRARGFRAPGGYTNGLQDAPAIRQLLIEQGFNYVSSQICLGCPVDQLEADGLADELREITIAGVRSQQPYTYEDGLLEIPTMFLSDEVVFRDLGLGLGEWLELVGVAAHVARREGLILSLDMHPGILAVRDPRGQTLRLLLKEAEAGGEDGPSRVVTNDRIAELWRSGCLPSRGE